jgi:hypothetical protein
MENGTHAKGMLERNMERGAFAVGLDLAVCGRLWGVECRRGAMLHVIFEYLEPINPPFHID